MPLLPLQCSWREKVSKSMARDLYLYHATARLQAGYLDDAMADCQVLPRIMRWMQMPELLTGKVALEMDGYDEAASDFEQAYGKIPAMARPSRSTRRTWIRTWKQMEPGIWRLFCLQMQREQRIFAAVGKNLLLYGRLYSMPRRS